MTVQLAMDIILFSVKWQFFLVYLDDFIIFSESPDRHVDHVRHVLTLLGHAG